MPIPDAERAVVSEVKVREYLLNVAHPDGGSKAIWFQSIGYHPDEWQDLAADLLAIARNCATFDTESTPFGVKYKALGAVGRKGYRPGIVLTVWIVEADAAPRLITAFPE